MKPLSEKLKEIPRAHWTTKLLLQAWLREADGYMLTEERLCAELMENPHYAGRALGCKRVRTVLLGTTRREGKK